MNLLYLRPFAGRGDRSAVAFVDVEISRDVRLYGLRLVRQPDGRFMTYAPQVGKRAAASFSWEMAEQITAATVAALGAAR